MFPVPRSRTLARTLGAALSLSLSLSLLLLPAAAFAQSAEKEGGQAPAPQTETQTPPFEPQQPPSIGAKPAPAGIELPGVLEGLEVHGLFYLSYQYGDQYEGTPDETSTYNRFLLKRGYLDVRKGITPWLTGRITTDIHQADDGSWNARIKYLYAYFHTDLGFLTGLGLEAGQVHIPWLDFEEAINGFRMQGTMFLERNHILNSADQGLTAGSNLGGSMPAEYKDRVNGHYAGRWGSWQLGVYNGGGYHASEKNGNKVVEGRLTIRPVPDIVPGLQVTGFGIVGKGNVEATGVGLPDWRGVDAMLSYQSPYFTGTAQYYAGEGNQAGTALDAVGHSLPQAGWSLFGTARLPAERRFAVIARWDRFDADTSIDDNDVQDTLIGGLAWYVYKANILLVDYQRVQHSLAGVPAENQVQATMQVSF